MFNHVSFDHKAPSLEQVTVNGTRYYITPEGVKYPSVTTVLSQYSAKHIYEWRKRVGDETANEVTRKASVRGTRFHKICEEYLDNRTPIIRSPLEDEMFIRFKPVLKRIDNIHAQELRMYSNHLRMAGTVDCIAEFDGKLSVVDFKTASKTKEKQYIENYFMQCAAYAIMFEELYNIPVPNIVVAIITEEGTPQVFPEQRNTFVDRLLHFRDLYEKSCGVV